MKKITKIAALFLVIMLSFGVIEPTYAASSKKPKAPKITSATVNGTSVTITWSKAKRAKKYEVAERTTQKTWVKYKTVKKTKKNKKKYTKANKYKVKAKGKKYIVYKYDYRYAVHATVSKRTYTIRDLDGNTDYTFAVRSVNGKKHSAWRTVTRKTGARSIRAQINGKPFEIATGKKVTLPLPSIPGITLNKKSFDIVPGNGEDDFYTSEDGDVIVRGKTPSGYDANYVYRPDSYFGYGWEKYSSWDDREKYGYLSYGSQYMSWPEEYSIHIFDKNMKAVWTLDGTEPQFDQTDKDINASEYPFGTWTKGGSIRIHGSTTESYKIPEVRWADSKGYGINRSAPIVVWVKLYQDKTLIAEDITIDAE